MKEHIEVWIGSRLLSKEKKVFTNKELLKLIKDIFNDNRAGLSTHICNICVANIPISKSGHSEYYNFLYRVSRGKYKIFKEKDKPHLERMGKPITPPLEDIPSKYRYL